MTIRKLKILDIFILFLLSFLFHFIYEWIPNFITSIFFPVNESIWEHMKLIYTPLIICIFIDYIFKKIFSLNIHNIIFANFYSAIISIIVYLIIYLPVDTFLGHSTIFAIILLFTIFILSQIISYHLITKIENIHLKYLAITYIIISYIVFGLLTYYPPQNKIFLDTQKNVYGINKKS